VWNSTRHYQGALAASEEAFFPEPPPTPEPASRFFSGLDLGQAQDYSALVILERFKIPDPDRKSATFYRFDVRHLHRWPLGTSYPAIVADLKEMYARPHLQDSALAIDATGVGRAVVDMVRLAGLRARCQSFTITFGEATTGAGVAKKDLVGAVQIPLQSGRLRFAEALELTPVLVKEMEAYRVKVTAARNETFEAWRERDHDDLVLALALAVYLGSRPPSFAYVGGERI